jgi:prepilin-type N-terminal cleavage/methylation domain-containing protein
MRTRRPGVTLIELLVVITIITALATLIVAVAPKFGERQRPSRGAGMLQSWLNLAKQRALRDQRPVGIRLPHVNGPYVTELQYVETPDEFVGGTMTVPYAPNYPTPVATYTYIKWTTSIQFNATNPPDPRAPLQPGDVIEFLDRPLGVYQPRRIIDVQAGAGPGPPPAPGYYNYQVIVDQLLPQVAFTTQSYRVTRNARPVVGEPTLQLPRDVGIDVDCELTPVGIVPKWYRMFPATANTHGTSPFDILFSPSGQVIGFEGNLGSRICLWVRDTTLNTTGAAVGNDPTRTDPAQLPPGYNSLVTIYTRTGHVTTHPIDPGGLNYPATAQKPWNPFKFTQDGLTSGNAGN